MPSSYPGALDNLPDPTGAGTLAADGGKSHSAWHALVNDAVDAVQVTLGVNPQGGSATVVARLTALDATVAGKEDAGAVATHAALTLAHGISAFGATLVDDADAATARATLGTDASGATRPPAAHTHPASEISDSTAAGRAVLTAADAAAQRTALGTDASGTARPPTSHASSHQAGGGDAIKLDDLAAPDDNTDLNATTSAHGLLPKLGGGTTNFLRADGTWAAPAGGGSPPTGTGFRRVASGVEDAAAAAIVRTVTVTLDGAGEVLTVGQKAYVSIPFACTITGWRILEVSDTPISGSCVVDVWKDTYANYPPTVADTIAGTEKPTLSSAIKNEDQTLTTWTTSISAGDVLGFNVDSASAVKRVSVQLQLSYTG